MTRKRNHSMAMRRIRLHPAERQIIRNVWNAQTVEAQIHALSGNDVPKAVEKTATLIYVALQAARIQGMTETQPEMRVLRATANALGDCVGRDSITDLERASLSAGLEAVKRLLPPVLTEESLFHSAAATKRQLGMLSLQKRRM